MAGSSGVRALGLLARRPHPGRNLRGTDISSTQDSPFTAELAGPDPPLVPAVVGVGHPPQQGVAPVEAFQAVLTRQWAESRDGRADRASGNRTAQGIREVLESDLVLGEVGGFIGVGVHREVPLQPQDNPQTPQGLVVVLLASEGEEALDVGGVFLAAHREDHLLLGPQLVGQGEED